MEFLLPNAQKPLPVLPGFLNCFPVEPKKPTTLTPLRTDLRGTCSSSCIACFLPGVFSSSRGRICLTKHGWFRTVAAQNQVSLFWHPCSGDWDSNSHPEEQGQHPVIVTTPVNSFSSTCLPKPRLMLQRNILNLKTTWPKEHLIIIQTQYICLNCSATSNWISGVTLSTYTHKSQKHWFSVVYGLVLLLIQPTQYQHNLYHLKKP